MTLFSTFIVPAPFCHGVMLPPTHSLFSTFIVPAPLSLFHGVMLPPTHSKFRAIKSVQCIKAKSTTFDDDDQVWRNTNYPPSFIKSLSSDYTKYTKEVSELKDEVKRLIHSETDDILAKLELLDSLQRLGLKYLFQKDIKKAVEIIYDNTDAEWLTHDLYSTALRFRLFRQHGYHVSQDVFRRFKVHETGNHIKASPCEDAKGLLSLYEASFFGLQGEDIIDDAKAFTTAHLKSVTEGVVDNIDPNLLRKVKHALDMPLHWKVPRLEARWYIHTYEQEPNMNLNLLKLAKLDYNIVQSIHQKEVGELARWWMDMGLDKLSFARDRLVEHYFWCNGTLAEPQYGAFREMGTKVICLITTIDNVYDVYGSVEELELFTDYVDRWDITEIDKLPVNIKTVLLALFNTTNEIGYWTMRARDFNIIPHLSKQWANLCKSYLKEAKWYHSGYKPTLDEYLENAVVSIAAPIMLFCAYFLTTEKIAVETLDYIHKLPSIMRSTSMILRLTNDLGTSSDELARGDTLKAIQCYMNDTGASEEMARKYIDDLVHKTWKTLNKDIVLRSYSFGDEPFVAANPNLARTAQCFYQYGDGHGVPDRWTKDHLIPLLVEPLTIN